MDLKLGHYDKDGIEVVDVGGEIDIYTAPRLRELLIDLVSKNNYQLVVNLDKVGFLDSTGLGVLVGGLKRVRAHDGSQTLAAPLRHHSGSTWLGRQCLSVDGGSPHGCRHVVRRAAVISGPVRRAVAAGAGTCELVPPVFQGLCEFGV